MEQKWELRIIQKEVNNLEKNYTNLVNEINNRLQQQVDGNFIPYIQNLVQEQLGLHQQNLGLINRLNAILKNQQGHECKQLNEKFTRKEIFTIILMMYFNLVDSNFNQGSFYQTNMEQMKFSRYQKGQEKHKCFLNYFRLFYQNFKNKEQEEVIFIRDNSSQQEIDLIPKDVVMEISKQFSATQNLIEDIETDNVIVDFADKNVGGLVLDGANCAQEEIMLLCYPEGVISSLFMTPMQNNEAIFIQNVIRYNYYKGYESTFTHRIQQEHQVIAHHILMIDATQYFNPYNQYQLYEKNREILKCFTGFKLAMKNLADKPITISTGKWGCGIFRGDLKLKFLIQLFGFCLAKQALQLKNQSSIRFSAFNDILFAQQIQEYQQRNSNQISELKEKIDKFDSQTNEI